MGGLAAAFRASDFTHLVERQLGPALAISKMMKEQNAWRKQFDVLNIQSSVRKGFGISKNSWMHGLLADQMASHSIAKAMESVLPKALVPPTFFSALHSINSNYAKIFQSLDVIAKASPFHSHTSAQVNNLHFAIHGLSGQMAMIAAAQKQWDLFDDLKIFSEQVSSFTDTLENETDWTEEVKKKWSELLTFAKEVYEKNKQFGVKVILVLSAISTVGGIHTYVDFLKAKPVPVTAKDLQLLRQEIKNDVNIEVNRVFEEHERLRDEALKENRAVTIRKCNVMLRPKDRSYITATLPKEFELTVIQNQHKWAYVEFYNPDDNLPQTGWVLKKYLTSNR